MFIVNDIMTLMAGNYLLMAFMMMLTHASLIKHCKETEPPTMSSYWYTVTCNKVMMIYLCHLTTNNHQLVTDQLGHNRLDS